MLQWFLSNNIFGLPYHQKILGRKNCACLWYSANKEKLFFDKWKSVKQTTDLKKANKKFAMLFLLSWKKTIHNYIIFRI